MQTKPTPIRVWTICYLYPPNFSGAGVQASREHGEFIRSGIKITVLTAGIDAAFPERGKSQDQGGVLVKYMSLILAPELSFLRQGSFLAKVISSVANNLSFLTFALGCAIQLLFAGRSGDIVRFESFDKYSIIPMAIARLKGMHPVIRGTLLGYDDPVSVLEKIRLGYRLQYLNLGCLYLTEAIVAISTAMLQSCQHVKATAEKVIYIPNSVDTELFRPAGESERATLCQEMGLDAAKRYIIFVGSAIERKGIDVIVDAFISLHAQRPDVELLIVGPNHFAKSIFDDALALQKTVNDCREKLTNSGCGDAVHWVGEVQVVHQYMKVADLFCFPTRQEGFPLAVIEAMSASLPIVVSYLDGITSDSIALETQGVKIHGHRPEDYSHAMLQFFENPGLAQQMGQAARERAVSVFGLDRIVQQWAELFEKLAG